MISHSVADKENSESLTSFSKITLGEIIKYFWSERVKHVKRGPRSDRKAAYLNIRRSEGGIRKSLGFTLEEISIPQTWTREIVAPGHYIFSRREKMDFNSQRLTLELSVKLSQSFQASYTIRSHGSVVDLESVLRNSGSTTPSALDLFWKRMKQLLPYPHTQQASFRTLLIVPRSQKREYFLTFV